MVFFLLAHYTFSEGFDLTADDASGAFGLLLAFADMSGFTFELVQYLQRSNNEKSICIETRLS